MQSRRYKTLALLFAIFSAAQQTRAQDRRIQRTGGGEVGRHALVVGNDVYQRSPLVNAINDARAMESTLTGMGFSVETVTDADYPTFDRAIDLFVERIAGGDVALFYYAGHGVQVDGENYLIPVDFERASASKVKYRTLPANLIRERMERSGARLSILILDACRDNPFSGSRSVGTGLAQMETGIGTFIAFSTAPGRTATDSPSAANGLFTRHLIATLEAPGLSIDEVFNEVRRKVYQDSDGRQIPWTASSLIGSFTFRPVPEAPPPRVRVSRRQATGRLDVTVDQGGAGIYLDGDHVATSAGAETVHLDQVPIGDTRVRVSKPGYVDVVRSVRVEPEATARLVAWLSPKDGVYHPEHDPEPSASEVAYAALPDAGDDFCASLEQVLAACPGQFRDVVEPSRSLTRIFLEPTVCLPGAWYNKVYRAGLDDFEYLSSFEADSAIEPQRNLSDVVSRVEACLPQSAIAWRQRRAERHQLKVALAAGDCRLDVALNGESVDLEIYQGR